ncbi:recombinase family protein [Streptomyces sp. NPDC055722]
MRERGIGLHVIEQDIDTATTEGQAMFGILSVLAELQRELIAANPTTGSAPHGPAAGLVAVGPKTPAAHSAQSHFQAGQAPSAPCGYRDRDHQPFAATPLSCRVTFLSASETNQSPGPIMSREVV